MVSTYTPKKVFGLIINEIYPKELDRFLINDLRKENIDFFLVDISKIIHKKSHNENFADISIDSLSDLNSMLKVNDYFILYFNYSLKYKKIYQLFLKHNNNKYFHIKNDPIPINSSYHKKLKLIFYNCKRLIRYPFLFYKFLDNKLKFLNTINLNIIAFEINSNNHDLCIPSSDYEIYKKISSKHKKEKNYHVFIDQNWPFHRDFDTWHALEDSEKYFSELRKFFDYVEKKTGKKVKVALHPRTKNNFGNYGKRELIKDDTGYLIYNSDLVIAHCSTAISYAVMMNKKILLLTSNQITPLLEKMINNFSFALNIPILNLSNKYKSFKGFINKKNYQLFLNEFVAKKTIRISDKKASTIVVDYLNKL